MREKTFGPEDIIIKEKELVNSIYFVLQGEASSYINLTSNTRKNTPNKLKIA